MPANAQRVRMDSSEREYAVQESPRLEHSPYAYDERELADLRARYNPRSIKARREIEKAKAHVAIGPMRAVAILLVLLVTAGAIGFLINRESVIARNQRKLHETKAELAELRRQNSVLQVRVDTVDSNWVEEAAKNRLNMTREPSAYIKVELPPEQVDEEILP